MFACSLAHTVARRARDARCTQSLARAAASLTNHEYDRLCNLSYWQNQHYERLQIEPLPSLRVDGVPVVHHPLYSAPQLRDGHRFPMQVFQTIHNLLLEDKVVDNDQVCNTAGVTIATNMQCSTVPRGTALNDAIQAMISRR